MAGIPQVITEDRASGAQFIEGSLRFDGSKVQHLTRTPTTAGNRNKWTWSGWCKHGSNISASNGTALFAAYSSNADRDVIRYGGTAVDSLDAQLRDGTNRGIYTTSKFRDTGWYHNVVTYDSAVGVKIYVNGVEQPKSNASGGNASHSTQINNTVSQYIGARNSAGSVEYPWDGEMSQVYFIDGQALGPENFGFTDPLTNTWRPKKFSGEFSPKHIDNWNGVTTGTGFNSDTVTENAFDGNPDTQAAPGQNGTMSFTPAPAITGISKIRIKARRDAGQATPSNFTLNGTTIGDLWTAGNTATVEITSLGGSPITQLTNLTWKANTNNNEWFGVYQIEVYYNGAYHTVTQGGINDFYLPMDGNSPIGEDKSGVVTLNDGTIWSNNLTSNVSLVLAASRAFDGDATGSTLTGTSNATNANLLFTKTFNNVVKLRVYMDHGTYSRVRVNGGSWVTDSTLTSTNASWRDLTSLIPSNGIVTSIESDTGGANNGVNWSAVEVNGYILVDGLKGNNWTPLGFGGSVDLPKATGALPILNTNDAGTVAKLGVRTDKKTYTVTASGGNYYLDGALKPTLNAYRGSSLTFDYTSATSHPLYLSSLPDGKHNANAYSVQFDGASGTDLQVANHTDLQVGSESNWTIEFFVRKTGSFVDYDVITGKGVGNSFEWFIEGFANGQVRFLYSADGTTTWTGDHILIQYMNDNQWYHFAAVRNGTSFKMYVDGIETFATTGFDIHAGTGPLHIGGYSGAADQDPPVQISNYRIVKGTSVYISNFTRPGTTLGNITNTKLLCCQNSSATTATVSPTAISSNGGVSVIQTHQPFLYIDSEGGVNTGTSNTTKITIPHWAADTLYYYCNVHSGMGSSINVTTDIFKADPYAWKCTLALPCLGNANDVSHLINCNATELPIVPQANAHADFSTGNFYGGSYDLDGSGDYINVNSSSPYSHVNFGYSDYTAECWVYLDGTGDEYVFNMSTNNGGAAPHWNINFYSTNLIRAGRTDSSGNSRHQITYVFPQNKWMHIAISRGGFTSKLFLDGVLIDSRSDDDGIVPIGNLNIGAYNNGGAELNGFVQDARIYNGVAKYTESFVVGSTAPDVLPDSPSGITGKTNLTKITEGAVAFSRSPESHLIMPDSNDLAPGGVDFTIETFMYARSLDNYPVIWDTRESNAGDTNGFFFGIDNTGLLYMYDQSAVKINGGAGAIGVGRWYHVALVRKNNDIKMYRDGVQLGSTYTRNHNFTNKLKFIGDSPNTEVQVWQFNGFYSNWRFTKGQALYDGNFDVPTEPLTATSQGATGSNVKLLACQSPTSVTAATVSPSFDIHVTSSNGGSGSVGNLSAITSTGSNYYLDYRTVGRAWVQLDFASTQSSVTSIKFSGGGYLAGSTFDFYVNGVLVANDRITQTLWAEDTITISSTDINSIRIDGVDGYAIGAVKFNDTLVSGTIGGITASGSPSATNFNPFTDDINTIRGQESGYATLNPLDALSQTLSNGNLTSYGNANTAGVTGTISASSGKYYYEMTAGSSIDIAGIWTTSTITGFPGSTSDSYGYFGDGQSLNSGSGYTYASSYTLGDVIGVALDLDNGTLRFYKNGIDQGIAFSNISGEYRPAIRSGRTDTASTVTVNFGQKPFKFPPPDGFQPWSLSSTQPEKVIARPDQYVQANIWSGDNTTRNFDIGMKPDFVWIKCRSDTAGHRIFDSVRGPRNSLRTASTDGQDTVSNFGYVSSFNNNGFTLTPGGYAGYESGDVNMTGRTYVGWTWKAGGNSNTFNIDDVGYANASDVNMNVGGLNSSVYNQSQTWSTYGTTTTGSFNPAITELFDNDITSGPSTPASSTATWTFTSGITASSSIEIYCSNGSGPSGTQTSGTEIRLTIDGTVHSIDGSPGWINTGLTGNLTAVTIHVTAGSGSSGLRAIKVDGKELVDSGVTPTNVPSISATGCSVGTEQGFSIVKFTGDSTTTGTIPHGLNKKPQFVIVKDLVNADDWQIKFVDENRYLKLNATDTGSTSYSNYTATDSVINLGYTWNNDSSSHIAYSWHDVPGLQKFGTYEGNTTEGAFVELGFRPAIIWIKSIDQTWYWNIHDSKRGPINPIQGNFLRPDQNYVENTASGNNNIDFLSNGFKIRSTTAQSEPTNVAGQTYFYAAWAEAPSINLYGAQANAR